MALSVEPVINLLIAIDYGLYRDVAKRVLGVAKFYTLQASLMYFCIPIIHCLDYEAGDKP